MDWLSRWTDADLARWEQRPFSPSVEGGPRPHDNQDKHERVIGQEAPGLPEADGSARRLAGAILRFDVFPPTLLTSVKRRTPVEVGDTLGLRYPFLPGIDLFFAARVIDRFEKVVGNQWCNGFTYRTLAGHPECGEETFIVEKDLTTGKVTAALRSWSRAGLWIARLAYPMVRHMQLHAAGAALDHLQCLAMRNDTPARSSVQGLTAASPSRRNLRTGLLRSTERW